MAVAGLWQNAGAAALRRSILQFGRGKRRAGIPIGREGPVFVDSGL